MSNYYSKSLNSNRLVQCYSLASQRVKQYLEAEIDFVLGKIGMNDSVLDLGCGYGRVTVRITEKAKYVVGIDISNDNVILAKKNIGNVANCELLTMDATDLKFDKNVFDLVFCIQNGISAFNVDPKLLFKEAIRVTRKGGIILFSSYSELFWEQRLVWFENQAKQGLIGEIDHSLTANGTIICKDGFQSTTFSSSMFLELASDFNVNASVFEIDNSSNFCEMIVK